jgi:hypothetical protein
LAVQKLKKEEMINRASQYRIKELMAQEMMSTAEMRETIDLGEDEDIISFQAEEEEDADTSVFDVENSNSVVEHRELIEEGGEEE